MRTLLTFDYELFFGKRTGTPQACLFTPCEHLLKVLDEFSAKAVFFVDASYLARIRDYSVQSAQLERDYAAVVAHIRQLEHSGHQIQLHIHPHWFDSWHDGNRWHMVTDRYRLAQWPTAERESLITRCTTELNRHLANKVFTFRAGGWCLQPFSAIAEALWTNGIRIDSSVFHGGHAESGTHYWDFRSAPASGCWSFGDDPCQPDPTGTFTELAISSLRISPLFYWHLAFNRVFGERQDHARFGDGDPIENGYGNLLRLLTRSSHMAVSVDGYKATLLRTAFRQAQRKGCSHFTVMGHPKSLSPYSLQHLRAWLGDLYRHGGQLEGYPLPTPVKRERATTAS
ncbi:polysaccharide deacetylase family protein [Microbulbifer bruguierae]|uniref:Polysaccharide deacetylase family protein n=1 Tax=Microbulbifer bruguierae TaxID=3029061 RepID=A0ABY8NH37_9GAMM|nr:polysaccharide deacetylase family protein [Microbulbifer bruguierae]WGL18241.1 polysaccharide deacetylase family protein [Microbulbifer bruguierae]